MTITKEQIQEYLNSDEGKAVFAEVFNAEIQARGYKAPDEITGLANKNRELLGEIVKLKNSKKDDPLLTTLQKYAINDIEDLENVLSTTTTTKGKADEVERMAKRLERELDTERKAKAETEKALNSIKSRFHSAEKQRAILHSLAEHGIDESAHDILSVYFDRYAKVEEDENGNISILADDGAQSLPLRDYIKQWSTTDKAKNYIKAPVNAGGGTSTGSAQGNKMTMEQIAQLTDPVQIAKALKENGL